METSFQVGGVFRVEHIRDGKVIDEWESKNIVTDEGLNHMLNATLHGTTQVSTWYIGLFEGNYTPVAGNTMAAFPAAATESIAYNEATRVEWDEADDGATAKVITNGTGTGATKATFTITATKTMYGAFLASSSAKSATTGTLFAASRFAAPRAVVANDQLLITYTVQAQSS
jgi:hypothetical protein